VSITLAVSLESLNKQGDGVRVEFHKHGDRFGHTIFEVRGTEVQPILESIEGTAEVTAPTSPPFAELHRQDQTLFLTGGTTLGHWSMSVQAIDGRVVFEVACRAKKATSHLGSMYRILAANPILEPGILELVGGTLTDSVNDTLRIVPSLQAVSTPTTIQWRYTVASKT